MSYKISRMLREDFDPLEQELALPCRPPVEDKRVSICMPSINPIDWLVKSGAQSCEPRYSPSPPKVANLWNPSHPDFLKHLPNSALPSSPDVPSPLSFSRLAALTQPFRVSS